MANSPNLADDTFVRGVLEDPSNDACLAFSDWLEEHGDLPRAELVRVQCELSRWVPDLAKRTALQRRERRVIAGHSREWLGPLHDLCDDCHSERGLAHLTFNARCFAGRSFAAGASEWLRRLVGQPSAAPASDWLSRTLVRTVRLTEVRKHLSAVARAPHLGAVTALDLSDNDLDDKGLRTLLSSQHLDRLAGLDLRGNRLTDAAVRALVAKAPPRLARLDLRTSALTADCMRALLHSPLGGRLKGLELNAPDLQPDTVRELVAWRRGRDLTERSGGLPVRLVDGLGMEFRLIPPGTFLMGSPGTDEDAFADEKPQHAVELTRPFYLGVYPVTQREFQAVMGRNPSYFTPDRGGGPLHPVEMVSWEDCRAFCECLSGREPGRSYRLPTEAEWEYACRAGTATRYFFGDDARKLGECAWYRENAGGCTHQVGTKRPNVWGLFDMHGNVWEWCEDGYGDYSSCNQVDPRGDNSGQSRVLRGGSWGIGNDTDGCRAAYRCRNAPAARHETRGFRVCFSSD
jgi:uncharacterized protein (TIGR02996 family)